MAVKKKTKSVKKSVKKKTKTFVSSKKVKKTATSKKIKSAKKSVSVKKTKKSPKKTSSQKVVSKKTDKKPSLQRQKSASKKTSPQVSAYLSGLEMELERILEKNRQVSIKGSEGFEYCCEENCDQPSTTDGYCRYHYMVSWDYIKKRNKILSEDKLKSWTTELIQNHSPRLLDYMVRDLSNEKDFFAALNEMKLAPKKSSSY